jgi:hypothetical protein
MMMIIIFWDMIIIIVTAVETSNLTCIMILTKASMLITIAARSIAPNVFARSNMGIGGSNLTRGMGGWLRLFCICIVLFR